MKKHTITLIPGDGTGPDVTRAARIVLDAADVGIEWDVVDAGEGVIEKYGTPLPEHVLESIRKNKIALKGPLTTPIGTGFRSVNVALRKSWTCLPISDLRKAFQRLRPAMRMWILSQCGKTPKISMQGSSIWLVRMLQRALRLSPGRVQSALCAMPLNCPAGRPKKVTAVHKANIMKCTDGLFLEVAGR